MNSSGVSTEGTGCLDLCLFELFILWVHIQDLEMDPKDKKFKETKVQATSTIRTDTGTIRGADLKPGDKVVVVRGVLHNPHSFKVKGPSSATIFNIGLPEK